MKKQSSMNLRHILCMNMEAYGWAQMGKHVIVLEVIVS